MARALDRVGERWALLVVRELLLGPKRFTDLRAGLPQVGPDVLSARLRGLEEAGVVRRDKLPPPAAARVYGLTERGRELEPVVLALGRWGSAEPLPPGDAVLSPDALMVALKTLFEPAAAGDGAARFELRLGEHRYRVRVEGGRLEVERGGAEPADPTVETDVATLAALLWHGRPLEEAQRAGDLRLTGSARAFARFLRLLPLAPAAESRAQR